MKNERLHESGFSAMRVTAMLSVVALIGIAGWKIEQSFQKNNADLNVVASAAGSASGAGNATGNVGAQDTGMGTDATSSNAEIAQLGPSVIEALASNYFAMKAQGTYTPEGAQQVGSTLATQMRAQVQYPGISPNAIKTDPDTSYKRMLAYRADLHDSLAPLLKNTRPELDYYDMYMQTNDPAYLTQLTNASQNYKDAVALTSKVVVPQDALAIHVDILNALQEFSTVLDVMVANAGDPITSAALLQNYNQGESDVRSAFAALIAYEKSKHE